MKKFFITVFFVVFALVTIFSGPSVAHAAGGPPVQWTHNSDGSWTVKTVVVPWEIKEIGGAQQQIFCGHNYTPCTATEYTFKVDGCPFVQVDYNDGVNDADDYFPGPTKENCSWQDDTPTPTTPPITPIPTSPATPETEPTPIGTTPDTSEPTTPPSLTTEPATVSGEVNAEPQTPTLTRSQTSTEAEQLAATGNGINWRNVAWFFIGIILILVIFRFISRRI